MRLHKVTYVKDNNVFRQEFHPTGDDASKRCSALKAEYGKECEASREQIEVPTTKPELIEWLNKNAAYTV